MPPDGAKRPPVGNRRPLEVTTAQGCRDESTALDRIAEALERHAAAAETIAVALGRLATCVDDDGVFFVAAL
jgi:hypothetical protein